MKTLKFQKKYFIAITFNHAAQIFNFPKNLVPGPVYEALRNINKRNVTLDLMEMWKDQIEQNKIAQEEKLKQLENKPGRPGRRTGRRPTEYTVPDRKGHLVIYEDNQKY